MKRLNDVRPPLPLNLRSALKVNLQHIFFLPLKNSCMKPAYNKPSVIFEGVFLCSCHFNLGD